ncbi:MAG: glycoside hydrolase family 2 TIM barrel-domain containing protein [Rikenellaceae bacterium]
MKITSLIITLLALAATTVTAIGQERTTSLNIEHPRTPVVPYSTASGANNSDVTAVRYALPIENSEWVEGRSMEGSTFSVQFEAPFSWTGRQSLIYIENASSPYVVEVDGVEVGRVYNSSMPAQFNVTRHMVRDGKTPITISFLEGTPAEELEGWKRATNPMLGEVMMLSQPAMYIRDVAITSNYSHGMINSTIAIAVKSESLNGRTSRINYELLSPLGATAATGFSDITLDMRGEDTIRVFVVTPDSMAWSAQNPNLYRLNVSTQHRGRFIEYLSFDLGVRSIESGQRGDIIINGVSEPIKAAKVAPNVELNRVAELKSLGYNTLKVDAGAYNAELFRYADSTGLYLIATAPINSSKSGDDTLVGGNPTNDPDRCSEYIERVDALYHTTKLHPSVIAYSIAEQSLNGINLYESYLHLKARELQRPIIYEDCNGEWNSDRLSVNY